MRKEWKGRRGAMLAAISACVALPTVAAQGAPTAKDAQEYLATMTRQVVTRVVFVDGAGRTNYVTGTHSGEVKTIKGGAFGKPKESVTALPDQAVEKQLADVRPAVLEPIDAYGRPTACATRLTKVEAPTYDEEKSDSATDNKSFSFKLTYTTERWHYEPLTKFMSPAEVIDWSNVSITRGYDGSVSVTSWGQAFAKLQMTYVAADPDVADRIEYAMKFLSMSCSDGTRAPF
jgi:hypothetical protein